MLYAELTFGTGMVMVAPIQESPLGKLMVQPDEIGGVETRICYLYIANTRAHYARAKAAGAEILLDIEAETRNGRGYSCRDLEGHVWNFGTHNPWHLKGPAAGGRRRSHRTARPSLLACCCLPHPVAIYIHQPAREAATNLALTILDKVSASIESAKAEQTPHGATDDSPLREMRELLSRERLARVAADRHVGDIREQLMKERRAREAAELAVKTAGESRVESSSLPSARVQPRRPRKPPPQKRASILRRRAEHCRPPQSSWRRPRRPRRPPSVAPRRRVSSSRSCAVPATPRRLSPARPKNWRCASVMPVSRRSGRSGR